MKPTNLFHAQQAEQPPTAAAAGAIALQGNIAVIAPENIFQLFALATLTGKLKICSPANCGTFYFNQGVLIYGMLQISPRKIGEILLESQLITEQQLLEGLHLHQQSQPRQPFGQILLELGYIEPDKLDDCLVLQTKDSFFETLSWQEGTFAFYHNEAPAPEAVRLQARVDYLLLEGMIYLDDIAASLKL